MMTPAKYLTLSWWDSEIVQLVSGHGSVSSSEEEDKEEEWVGLRMWPTTDATWYNMTQNIYWALNVILNVIFDYCAWSINDCKLTVLARWSACQLTGMPQWPASQNKQSSHFLTTTLSVLIHSQICSDTTLRSFSKAIHADK